MMDSMISNSSSGNNYFSPPIVSTKHKSMITFNYAATTVTVMPSNSHADLLNQPQQKQQQQQDQGSPNHQHGRISERKPSPRPFKKRMIESSILPPTRNNDNVIYDDHNDQAEEATLREEEEISRRRKVLASKLRADNVSQRIMIRPSDYVRTVFVKNGLNPNKLYEYTTNSTTTNANNATCSQDCTHYPQPTQLDIDIHRKHSQELYDYVRCGNDLDGFKRRVRELKQEYYPQTTATATQVYFRCCNKFGESLMHLACRHGRTDMVQFLIEELNATNNDTNEGNNVSSLAATRARQVLSIRDDYNKTPFHDACWTTKPNFDLIDLLLKYVPEQLLTRDVRNKTPFDYVQQDDYIAWLKFIWERKSLFKV
jgi:hypothetical protein